MFASFLCLKNSTKTIEKRGKNDMIKQVEVFWGNWGDLGLGSSLQEGSNQITLLARGSATINRFHHSPKMLSARGIISRCVRPRGCKTSSCHPCIFTVANRERSQNWGVNLDGCRCWRKCMPGGTGVRQISPLPPHDWSYKGLKRKPSRGQQRGKGPSFKCTEPHISSRISCLRRNSPSHAFGEEIEGTRRSLLGNATVLIPLAENPTALSLCP